MASTDNARTSRNDLPELPRPIADAAVAGALTLSIIEATGAGKPLAPDRLVVLDGGKIAEMGTHAELMEMKIHEADSRGYTDITIQRQRSPRS